MRVPQILSVSSFLALASLADAQVAPEAPTAVDVIPSQAEAAIATNDIAGLHDRVRVLCEKLRNDSQFAAFIPFGFEVARSELKRCTGLKTVDSSGSAAWVFWEVDRRPLDNSLIAMPVKSLKVAADELGVSLENLQLGNIVRRPGKLKKGLFGVEALGYVSSARSHLWFGVSQNDLKSVRKFESLRELLDPDEVERFSKDGLIFYLRPDAVSDSQESLFGKVVRPFLGRDLKPKEFKFATWSLNVRDGWGATMAVHFDNKDVTAALSKLAKGRTPANLAGLPNGKMIAASAFAFGDSTTEVLSDVVRELAKPLTEWQAFSAIVARQNLENIFDVLIQSWHGISMSRFAAYLNQYPSTDGLASAVMILDTDNAAHYIAELVSLEHFVNAALIPESDRASVDDELLDKLVGELSADKFRVRQLAYVKLKLLGRAAAPKLEEASNSQDPEVRYRARSILKELQAAAPGQLKKANELNTDALTRLGLQFAYIPDRAQIAGQPVAHIQIRLNENAPGVGSVKEQLKSLLGPGWRTIQLVALEKKVIAFWGSDQALLERTIRNVLTRRPGLAAAPQLAAFRNRTNAATIGQIHLSLSQIAHLLPQAPTDAPIMQAESALSLGVGLTPNRLRMDLHLGEADLSAGLRQYTISRSR